MVAVASLIERRVPHYALVYVGVSWGFVQFVDFMVDEFLMSPHWTRVALATALLLFPSVLMLAYYHGKPGQDQFVLAEKIGIPANLLVAALILVAAYGGTDLGAAVTTVTVETEEGETVERVVAKSEFRKRTAIFAFDPGPGLAEEDGWMSYMAPYAITMDLASDDFFEPLAPQMLQGRLQEAGFQDLLNVPLTLKREVSNDFHAQYALSGTVDRAADGYQVSATIHEIEGGDLIHEGTYSGDDFLALVDDLSVDVKDALDIPDREEVEDLPVRERLTTNDEALASYGWALQTLTVASDIPGAIEHLTAAVEADPTFADAQHTLGTAYLFSARVQEAMGPMQAALNNVYKLPERAQFIVKSNYYFTTRQQEKALAVIEMWAELHPQDLMALQNLLQIQQIRDDREGMLATLETIYELNPKNTALLKQIASMHRVLGNDDAYLAALEEYAELNPNDYTSYSGLASYHRRQGAHDVAREHLDRALLMEPGLPDLVRTMASLDGDVGRFAEATAGYERALQMARTPQERVAAHASLRSYHEFRGEMSSAIEHMDRWFAEAAPITPPLTLLQQRFADIDTYFEAGRGEDGVALFEQLKAQLQPPMDAIVPLGAMNVAIELEDLEGARAAHAQAVQVMETMQMELLRTPLIAAQARIDELAEDYASAAENYRQVMELNPTANLHTSVARALRHLGELESAEASLAEALRLSPANPQAHLQMAHVLEAKGDLAGAIEHLEMALAAWENADDVFEPAREARENLERLAS